MSCGAVVVGSSLDPAGRPARGNEGTRGRSAKFVRPGPLKGLGVSIELIDRLVGQNDLDCPRLFRKAKAVGQGHRTRWRLLDSQRADRGGWGHSPLHYR